MTIDSIFNFFYKQGLTTDFFNDNKLKHNGVKRSKEVKDAYARMLRERAANQQPPSPPSRPIDQVKPITMPAAGGTTYTITKIVSDNSSSPFIIPSHEPPLPGNGSGFSLPLDPAPGAAPGPVIDPGAGVDTIMPPMEDPFFALDPGAAVEPVTSPDVPSFFKLGGITALLTKVGAFLPLIPPLLYSLYTSEERILQNANVNILATHIPKIYRVGFGNKDGEEMSIDFEVVSGRFYQDEVIQGIDGFAYTIFQPKSLLSYFPLLRRFEWKRQIPETECNVMIDDPGNPSLQNGPISVYYPLSENEGFNLIYRDPTANTAITRGLFNHRTHDYYLNAEDSDYTTFNVASTKIIEPLGRYEKERPQLSYLEFDDDPRKANDYYMSVTQFNPHIVE